MRRRIGQITIGDINKPVWVDIWKDNNENPYVILTFNVKEYHYAHESYVHKYAEALGFRSRYIYSRYGSYVKFNLSLPLDNAQVYLEILVNVTTCSLHPGARSLRPLPAPSKHILRYKADKGCSVVLFQNLS